MQEESPGVPWQAWPAGQALLFALPLEHLSGACWQHSLRAPSGKHMTVANTSTISTRLLKQASDDAIPSSEITFKGAATGKFLAGAFLEAAFSWNELFLVFLTDDIPNEETLRIYLLDQALNVIDWARLGAMYSTGHLSGLETMQPDAIRFRFFGDTDWMLRLLPAPSFALPIVSDPPGVKRPYSFSRRFHLTGTPRPDELA